MSRGEKDDLEESWNFEIDESNISWADDSSQEQYKPSPSRSARDSLQQTRAPIRSEPQFIMPSMQASPIQPRKRVMTQPQSSQQKASIEAQAKSSGTRGSRPREQDRGNTTLGEFFFEAADNSLRFVLDIIGQTLRTLKTPISWILAAYALAAFVTFTQNLITSSLYSAISPICRIPGAKYLDLPMCHLPATEHTPQITADKSIPVPEFDALMATQAHFEEIMSDQSTNVGLPMDMKKSETSIRDLRQVVRFSNIPSKNELLHEFDGFVETARIASYDLQKFNSHVGRGVDAVLSTARWTQRVLDDIDLKSQERGLLPAFISDTLLAPFQPVQFTEARLLNQYIEHTHVVSGEIERLIDEAQILLQTLQNLEDRLEVIHSISLRDGEQVSGDRDEILGHLWSKIGGNKAKRDRFERQLKLLRQVGQYRKSAFAHVANTIVKLQGMQSELEELRTRVGSAAAAEEAGARHVPLSVHIENIKLGVERLEIGREKARELEQRQNRRVLDGSVGGGAGEVRYLSSD